MRKHLGTCHTVEKHCSLDVHIILRENPLSKFFMKVLNQQTFTNDVNKKTSETHFIKIQNELHVALYVICAKDLNVVLQMLFLATKVGIGSNSSVAVVVFYGREKLPAWK